MALASNSKSALVAGRLALDFANISSSGDLPWDDFVTFLIDARLVSQDRAARLRPFGTTEPSAVDAVLLRALRLRESLRRIFACMVNKEPFPSSWAEPVNEILRITEGHDELVFRERSWSLQFVAREGSLEWLLAAVARVAAGPPLIRYHQDRHTGDYHPDTSGPARLPRPRPARRSCSPG